MRLTGTISSFRWAELAEKVSADLAAVRQRVFAPGRLFPFHNFMGLGKLAMETGWAILYEVEGGVFRLTEGS